MHFVEPSRIAVLCTCTFTITLANHCQQAHAVHNKWQPATFRLANSCQDLFSEAYCSVCIPEKAAIAGSELCCVQNAGSCEAEGSALDQAVLEVSRRQHLPKGCIRQGF